MKTTLGLVTAFALLVLTAGAAAEEVAGLPLHVERLGQGAMRVWVGDYVSSTSVVALATRKGVVVVDTVGIPVVDTELRRVIARELGRDDFSLLVNTHEHGDHTGGNTVYADCTIVGHALCAAGMEANLGHRQAGVDWLTRRIGELEREVEQKGDAEAVKRLKEELVLDRLNLELQKSGARPVPPTKTFSDRLTVDMGDTTVELYYLGGMHSSSDIAVFVPDKGLLMTGDTMADVWLTDSPGCLAAFMARDGVRHDFPLLLENWRLLLAQKDRIKDLIPGHWNGDLSIQGFEARYAYVKALWEGVARAVREGKGLADLQAEYRLETRFPELASSPGFDPRNNATTIMEMWKTVTGQESAAARLYNLVDQGAAEAPIREVVAERDRKGAKYYFMEAEVNAHGYRFLQAGKVSQAVTLFRLNVELYPDAWNVYDSLGEALLAAGEVAEATRMYEKSVALNPDNANGKEALARIRSAGASE